MLADDDASFWLSHCGRRILLDGPHSERESAEGVAHVDHLTARVIQHQGGERLLERISRCGLLRAQRLFRDELNVVLAALPAFENLNHLQWAEGVGSAELHGRIAGLRMVERQGRKGRHIVVRNPADPIGPRSVYLSFGIRSIESQSWTQPYLHKASGLQDRVRHPPPHTA